MGDGEAVGVDFEFAVALKGAEVGYEPEAFAGEAIAGEGRLAGDRGFDFGGVGFDVLGDDGFSAAVEVGGFLFEFLVFGFGGEFFGLGAGLVAERDNSPSLVVWSSRGDFPDGEFSQAGSLRYFVDVGGGAFRFCENRGAARG